MIDRSANRPRRILAIDERDETFERRMVRVGLDPDYVSIGDIRVALLRECAKRRTIDGVLLNRNDGEVHRLIEVAESLSVRVILRTDVGLLRPVGGVSRGYAPAGDLGEWVRLGLTIAPGSMTKWRSVFDTTEPAWVRSASLAIEDFVGLAVQARRYGTHAILEPEFSPVPGVDHAARRRRLDVLGALGDELRSRSLLQFCSLKLAFPSEEPTAEDAEFWQVVRRLAAEGDMTVYFMSAGLSPHASIRLLDHAVRALPRGVTVGFSFARVLSDPALVAIAQTRNAEAGAQAAARMAERASIALGLTSLGR